MRRLLYLAMVIMAALLAASCSTDQPTAPRDTTSTDTQPFDAEQIASRLVSLSGWPVEDAEALPPASNEKFLNWIVDYQREELVDDIVHYSWDIQVSFDPMDVVTLHRVVRERGNWPVRTRLNLFLQHGDAKDFRGMFLPGTLSATTPVEFGAAVYWAQRGVDVWGLDQAWNNVPAEQAEFGFMAEWGLDKQYRDLGLAVTVARLARLATGNGFGKMNLLGYSSGSATGYALVNAETQLPPGLRQVGGWIPVDYSPLSDNEEWNEFANCALVPAYQSMMDSGEYGYFVGFDFMGILAVDDPDGPSPVPGFEGLTNLQAAMFVGAGPIFGVPDIHYLAGVWEDGLPVDLVHCTQEQWLDFMVAGAPWEPVKFMLDYATWSCREEDVPWDDHLAEISIPVLNVAADGGIGPTTYDMLDLLGSDDVSSLDVGLLSPEEALFDIGHIDLWIGDIAPDMVWQPILDWVDAHTPGQGNHGNNGHRN